MIRKLLTVSVLLAFAATCSAQEKKEDGPRVIKLAAQATKPSSSSSYRLTPDDLDMVEGNAALLWSRTVMAQRAVRYKWTEKQWKWSSTDETPLDKLPLEEVKAALKAHANALQLADQAALRTRCDWGRPPLTIQNLSTDLPLDEIAGLRETAHLLTLRSRVELAERRFDDALRTLQTGFAIARHLNSASSHLLIEDLVGVAIATIMLGRIEEWIEVPGSPNLYWALTELPRPLIDTRNCIRFELNTIYRSFPALRELKQKKLSAEEAQLLVEKVFKTLTQNGLEVPAWMKKMGTASIALKYYPVAKKGLIAAGRPAKEVEAMPSLQVVALYYMQEYDRGRDEILRWVSVPAWQGREQLEKVEAKYQARGREDGNVLIRLLVPAISKVTLAQLRLERQIAGLRGAEALRLHVTATGKLPAQWADVTEVPGPIDPLTGKGFDTWYKIVANKGVLEIPTTPGMPARLGRRFEISPRPAGGDK